MLNLKVLSFDPQDTMYQVLYTGHDGASKQYGMTDELVASIWETGEYPSEFAQYPGFIEMLQVIYCIKGDGGETGCLVGEECELRSASPD